jgi:hypothetical protein
MKKQKSDKLSKHNMRTGRSKQKTRESTKKWKEEKTKKFWDSRAESKKNKPTVEIKPSTIDWAKKMKKEEEDYGYFLSRGEPC